MKNLTNIIFLGPSVWLLFALLLGTTVEVQAQHPFTPVHYGQFRTSLNPATSLLQLSGELGTIGRRQWVGMEGSPTVFWVNGHAGFSSLGATAGLNLRHESLGVEQLTETSVYFAKSVRLAEQDYMGLSLNAGLVFHEGRYSQIDPLDPAFRDDIRNTDGLIGFSLVFYRPERYYAGVSMPRLIVGRSDDVNHVDLRPHYHLIAGGLFSVGNDFHVRPAMLLTYAKNLGVQADFSGMFFMRKMIGLGLNVRTNGDLAGMFEVNYIGFGLNYGYQFNPGNRPLNRRIDNSTHEIGISYRFGGARSLL